MPLAVPFSSRTGNMLSYPSPGGDTEWRKAEFFEATLTFTYAGRSGMSAIHCNFVDEQGVEYNMFLSELSAMLPKVTMVNGKVSGLWGFIKRGADYSIRFVER